MYRTTVVSAIALGLICAAPVSAQLPQKAAPRGMLQVTSSTTGGRILTSHMSGTSSARKMLGALKMVSGEYFDGPMTVTRAFADEDDQNLQAAFTAKLKGVPVHGVAAVMMNGDSGQCTLMFDNARTFTSTFRGLTAKQNAGGGGGGHMAKVELTRQTAPDGSCQISLPAGFRIADSFKGTLDIVGPNGAYMGLGCPTLATRPEAAAMFPGIAPLDFNDPVRAMQDYVHYMARKAGQEASVKILDYKSVPGWTTGKAALIRYEIQIAGKTTEGFGLFSISQTDVNQAMFYQSFMNATPEHYRTQFPAMMQAWGTYSINPSVFTERLIAAAQSMRGMSDIITSTNEYRQQVYAKVNEAWDDVIRDQSTWSNPTTGARYKISNSLTNNGGIPMQNGTELQPVPTSEL